MIRLFAILSFLFLFEIANAQTIHIVAFGGSNTFGKNLSRSSAYPAQLEAMLKAKGYDVVIANEGTNGQTTSDELGKIDSAIPEGTKIVIFQPGGNDKRKGGDTTSNIDLILQKLLARKILILFSAGEGKKSNVAKFDIATIDAINKLAPNDLQPDGQHLTEKGYRLVAEQMLPKVEQLIRQLNAK